MATLVVLLAQIAIAFVGAQYYISLNGTDVADCGEYNNPCGTLYYISYLMLHDSYPYHDPFIYIIDGQNQAQIEYYKLLNNTNGWNPCLPMTVSTIKITFGVNNENIWRDWYPLNICDYPNNAMYYRNKYLFDGVSVTLNHLSIHDYQINYDTNYPITRSKMTSRGYSSSIIINHGSFINITSSTTQALFYSNSFSNGWDLIFVSSSFQNVSATMILKTSSYYPDYGETGHGNLTITGCDFIGINCTDTMFYDGSCCPYDTIITNNIIGIIGGRFYSNAHQLTSNINIYNLSIQSNQLTADNTKGIFNFGHLDNVNMSHITILYNYNASKNCQYDGISSHPDGDSNLNANCTQYSCKNPILFINNMGQINIDNINIDIDIYYGNIKQMYNKSKYHYFYYEDGYAFIINDGLMNITKADVANTICSDFITNRHQITITNMSILQLINNEYDPNSLHSHGIIQQSATHSNLFLENVYFIGSYYGLHLLSGSVTIINSSFQQMTSSAYLSGLDAITMKYCQIKNCGAYNGPFIFDYSGFLISDSNNIVLTDNIFEGFQPWGLIYIGRSSSILFANNTIYLDASDLFYNISDPQIYTNQAGSLSYWDSTDTSTINNEFYYNLHQFTSPFPSIFYSNGRYGVNCLSGNTFTNYALYAEYTDITSCFRKDLFNCISNNSMECKNGIYGTIDPLLFDDQTTIFVNNTWDNTTLFSTGAYGKFALDNVNITIISSTGPIIILSRIIDDFFLEFGAGNILLVDSYISDGYDLLYDNVSCNLLQNNRLGNNVQFISSLSLSCDITKWYYMTASNDSHYDHPIYYIHSYDSLNSYDLVNSMNSSITCYVDHLSQVQLNLSARSSLSYYPGNILSFDHYILDKLGHEIVTNYTSELSIYIVTSSFA
eukprot:179304_1